MLQGVSSGFDIMYLALAGRNMQVRFDLKDSVASMTATDMITSLASMTSTVSTTSVASITFLVSYQPKNY